MSALATPIDIALAYRQTWRRKPILRELYRDFCARIEDLLAEVGGPTIELGSGPGVLKSFLPNVLTSDLVAAPWLDFAADATALPIADGSVGNIIMTDLLHHLPRPQRFLAQAVRVLKPGGRVIILDVFLSPLSWPVFRFLHPERATLSIRPLDRPADEPLFDSGHPWNGDQGIARAIFWKQTRRLQRLFPELKIAHRECLSMILYPMSGGFKKRNLLPRFAEPVLWKLERALERFGPYAGDRCLIALERAGRNCPAGEP